MQADEARAVGALAGSAMAGVATFAQDMHEGILRRVAATTPGGRPVTAVDRAVAAPVYGGVRALTRGLGAAAGAVLGRTRAAGAPPLADSPAGAIATGALSGLYGDLLEDARSPLAVRMSLRDPGGRQIATDPEGLAAAHPEATRRLVVLVHGLGETERAWRLFAPPEGPADYGARLREDLGHTPLYLRLNSGLAVAENGRRLATLLEEVVAGWPARVEEIVLIGHSMGGLVTRCAAHHGAEAGHGWAPRLRHVFCLASPHHGAPLAKAVHGAAWALARIPETNGLARVLDLRSAGIRDLRNGPADVPFVPTATYYALSAAITRDEDHALGRLCGDLLVRRASASGHGPRGRRVPFEIDNGHHAGGLNHFSVLNHPDVYRQIRRWLERAPALTAGASEYPPV
jgi:pimeloyl-ACP methyl ester carboxylesterase